MRSAAFCKKCEKEQSPAYGDNSNAYMIGLKLSDIRAEINKHFKNFHNVIPKPVPESLSWDKDFTTEYVELGQYGGYIKDMSHLYFTFKTRQFKSDEYMISVITRYHYDQCIDAVKNKRRIDIHLFEYF